MMSEATDKSGNALTSIPEALEENFQRLAEYLKRFPNVLIIGPGDA